MGSPLTLVHEVKLCRRQLLLQLQLMALRCLVRKSAIRALKVRRIAHTFVVINVVLLKKHEDFIKD